MDPTQRTTLLRAALRLAAHAPAPRELPQLPIDSWDECDRWARRWRHAITRNWPAAAAYAQQILEIRIRDLQRRLNWLEGDLPPRQRGARATARELLDDLQALDEQFDGLTVDRAAGTICLVTDPIVLDGVDLGPFCIRLDEASVGGRSPRYRVTAETPRPAAPNSEATHPHVSGDLLCEGEAREPIRRALAERRLYDFFTIVVQTLATYNRSSAFVPLDEWDGSACSRCGEWLDDEESTHCERCHDDVCRDCSTGCNDCSRALCDGCSAGCPACDNSFCHACLSPCEDCHEKLCTDCLEEGQCPGCRAEAVDDEELDAASPGAAADPADPLRLVQTRVAS